jgi:ATPase subunit of ABC transporter with duplicated ATPase domains
MFMPTFPASIARKELQPLEIPAVLRKNPPVITITDLAFGFGERMLFKDVNLKFTPGNCYGIIGANGSGKSTLLRILSGEIKQDKGDIIIPNGKRMTILNQDHFAFEECRVLDTVMMGWSQLHAVKTERETLYAKADFTEADGIRASELEAEFAELGGWEAEAQAAILLSGLGVVEAHHEKVMREVDEGIKVRVLLAQALFGNPDILLLDEPTNGLDLDSISWLENYLIDFPNIVIVVSHDRHFLNAVCTHTCDIDFGKVRLYAGNYDFWYRMNRILVQQQKDLKKKNEEKAKDLKEFIQRFSSNASKSKQATSRKKVLEKLELKDIVPSSRRFPYVGFKPEREVGNNVLRIESLAKTIDGAKVLNDFSLIVNRGEKIAFVGREHIAKTILFDLLAGEKEADSGAFYWGQTTSLSYFPRDNTRLFDSDLSITDWLKGFSGSDDDTYIRSFLGRMLFSGDEALKPVRVLSGGEKVRCLLSRMMLSGANCLIMDEPTNHLDLEAITALNDGLMEFEGVLLFTSHDHEFITSIATRIVEICPGGLIDRYMSFDEYLVDKQVSELRDQFYHGHVIAEL